MLSMRILWDRPNRPPDGIMEHILFIGLTPPKELSALSGNYCILLDCSGSMKGTMLEDAKTACRMVINNLKDEDAISLMVFNKGTEVVFTGKRKADLERNEIEGCLARLKAQGVTRADLAISEAHKMLSEGRSFGQIGTIIFITDGHPTDQEGRKVNNYFSLYSLADQLTADNICLITVGLGSAENYNSNFLTTLADHGKGCFCYAPESSGLAEILAQEFNALQSRVIKGLAIQLTASMQGVNITGFCRMTPQYLPLETRSTETGRWIYSGGTLGAGASGAETIFLVRLETYGMFGMEKNSYPILEVACSWEAKDGDRQVGAARLAYLKYTPILREQQEVNKEVQRLRLRWDMNLCQRELARGTDHMHTEKLLQNIAAGAKQLDLVQVEEKANAQLRQIKESGQLDQNHLTRTGCLLRSTGYLDLQMEETDINNPYLGIGFGGGKTANSPNLVKVSSNRQLLTMDLAALQVIKGRRAGVCIPLNKVNLIMGRTANLAVDIDLNDQEQGEERLVSRRHAELSWEQGKLLIRDLGSARGTFVNNERLPSSGRGQAGGARELKCGDLLRLADIELKVIVQ